MAKPLLAKLEADRIVAHHVFEALAREGRLSVGHGRPGADPRSGAADKFDFSLTCDFALTERGGPLAQRRLYNYRSGWRQRTSDKPRTFHARRSHTVYEGVHCN